MTPTPAPVRFSARKADPGRTRNLVLAALFAALLGASAYVAIPTPWGVPFTLQVLAVLLAGLVMSPSWAFAAVAVYLLLGTAGAPVFAGPSGGLGVVLGPTGGYLAGFAAAAPIVALWRVALERRLPAAAAAAAGCVAGIAIIYLLGWLRLGGVTGMSPAEAFAVGILPYVAFDAVKAAAAIALAAALRKAGVTSAVRASA